jgi:hypothetical protein
MHDHLFESERVNPVGVEQRANKTITGQLVWGMKMVLQDMDLKNPFFLLLCLLVEVETNKQKTNTSVRVRVGIRVRVGLGLWLRNLG